VVCVCVCMRALVSKLFNRWYKISFPMSILSYFPNLHSNLHSLFYSLFHTKSPNLPQFATSWALGQFPINFMFPTLDFISNCWCNLCSTNYISLPVFFVITFEVVQWYILFLYSSGPKMNMGLKAEFIST